MAHARVKLIVASLAIVVAVTLLAVAGVREGLVYSLSVDQFLDDGEYAGQRVRLTGLVSEENVQTDAGLLMARFDLVGEDEALTVEYHGIIPEMFKPGHEVVVEGELDGAGVFQADTLMTKCASKYESEGEGAMPPDHPATESPE